MNADNTQKSTYSTPPVLTVSALNQAVARMLERTFPLAWIAGEISNFTRAASGHWYFTLKDEAAQVRAVMFRGRAQFADFMPREGDKVEVRALVTLYAPRGDYQLNVEAIRRAGVGDLYQAFLQLKERLHAEGLFDAQRKRALPHFAHTVGIITSPQAAALRDVLITLQRRAPHVRVILYPVPVQGTGSAQKIAQAIATASARAECDLLLLCRGGGGIEDLWSFNEEIVARAMVASAIPVIAGIGHETDFTIADFVADLRSPTPTAAAEMAATPRAEWITALQTHAVDMHRAFKRQLTDSAQRLDSLAYRLVSPSNAIRHRRMQLAGYAARMPHAARSPLTAARFALSNLQARLSRHKPDIHAQRARLADSAQRIAARTTLDLMQRRQQLASLGAQLELLNPQRTLERGYAIITDEQGRIVRIPHRIKAGQQLAVALAHGSVTIGVASVQARLEEN